MTQEKAQTAITISALVSVGMFAYRKVSEPELAQASGSKSEHESIVNDYKSVFGAAPPTSWGQYIKAAGSLYIALAIIGAASPDFGGSAAALVGVSAFLGNFVAVRNDLHASEQTKVAQEQAVRNFKPTGQPPTSGHLLRR